MTKTALIIGTTKWFWRSYSLKFGKYGINLTLCGKRLDRLNTTKTALEHLTKVHLLNFNILINNAKNAHGLDSINEGVINN